MTGLQASEVKQVLESHVEKFVKEWHSSRITGLNPISGEFAERIVALSFEDEGYEVDHLIGSHRVGADLYINETGVSLKTGKTNSNNILTISGSRTSSYETLTDKLNFLDETKPDLFVCFSRTHNQTFNCTDGTYPVTGIDYKLIIIENEHIKYGNAEEWDTSKNNPEYETAGLKLKLKTAMNSQVWYDIDLDTIKHTALTISV